jgi:hypothetical protein
MFIARWDLDKTYLRTDFDTLRDLLRTAVERPDQKRTVPGAAALMRELGDAGTTIHILSGSPEQLRGRIVDKLLLDGVRYASLTLKPNLQNLLRLRLRAVRGQLGFKLGALLLRRCEEPTQRDAHGELVREALLGDDAEADAFVYSLYADLCAGVVDASTIAAVMRAGRCYEDDIADVLRYASYVARGPVVERILIHLARQSAPTDFDRYGPRVVPFYNYLQAAFVLFEDGRLSPRSLLRVAQDMAVRHLFDGDTLARSYLDLARRGHVGGTGLAAIAADYAAWIAEARIGGGSELGQMVTALVHGGAEIEPVPKRSEPPLDYLALVHGHNRRQR